MSEPVQKAFLYKGDKAEIFLESEVEAMTADGWFDNPTDAKAPPAPDPAPEPEPAPSEPVPEPEPAAAEVAEPEKRGPGRPRKEA